MESPAKVRRRSKLARSQAFLCLTHASKSLVGADGVCSVACALGSNEYETIKHFCLTLAVPPNSPLTFNAARGSEDAMKELAGKSSLQAVVDAALAACAAQHAAAKALCA